MRRRFGIPCCLWRGIWTLLSAVLQCVSAIRITGAVYSFTSRRNPDPKMSLFDFPTPNTTVEQRNVTNVPLQRLYMLNSSFVEEQAQLRLAPGLCLLPHGLEVPLHPVHTDRDGVYKRKALRVFGQDRLKHAGDDISES